MQSIADRVRNLLHLENFQISDRVGCAESYVRTVRQRTDAAGFPKHAAGERGWMQSDACKTSKQRYWAANKDVFNARRRSVA